MSLTVVLKASDGETHTMVLSYSVASPSTVELEMTPVGPAVVTVD